jgi:hypothetical protein
MYSTISNKINLDKQIRMHLTISSDTFFKNYFGHGIKKTTNFIAFLDSPLVV